MTAVGVVCASVWRRYHSLSRWESVIDILCILLLIPPSLQESSFYRSGLFAFFSFVISNPFSEYLFAAHWGDEAFVLRCELPRLTSTI